MNVIVKINEKHRVKGKGAFKVLPELESFSFQIERASNFICGGCLKKLKNEEISSHKLSLSTSFIAIFTTNQ